MCLEQALDSQFDYERTRSLLLVKVGDMIMNCGRGALLMSDKAILQKDIAMMGII